MMTKDEEKQHWISVAKRYAKIFSNGQLQSAINRLESAYEISEGKIFKNFPDYEIRYKVYKNELAERFLLTKENHEEN